MNRNIGITSSLPPAFRNKVVDCVPPYTISAKIRAALWMWVQLEDVDKIESLEIMKKYYALERPEGARLNSAGP